MPNGHVKVFDEQRNYGFLTTEEGKELYVHGDAVGSGTLHSGDEVEFEIEEGEYGAKRAVDVTVTKKAPPNNPVGRTLTEPPSWDQLEAVDRERRAARRRRR